MMYKTEKITADNRQKLHFTNPVEDKPGQVLSKFYLTSGSSKAKTQFPGILSMGEQEKATSWSADGNYLSVAVASPFECFLIVNNHTKQFAVVKVRNIRVLSATCSTDRILVGYAEEHNPELSKPKKYPTRLFLNPDKLSFKYSALSWYDFDRLESFKTIAKEVPLHELHPIENGWMKFEGKLPQTTELIVWELKEFAKYGDKQSEEWLKELMTRTNEPNLWLKTSDYIGLKQRS